MKYSIVSSRLAAIACPEANPAADMNALNRAAAKSSEALTISGETSVELVVGQVDVGVGPVVELVVELIGHAVADLPVPASSSAPDWRTPANFSAKQPRRTNVSPAVPRIAPK